MNQHWKSQGSTMVSAPIQYAYPTSAAGPLHQHQHSSNTGAAPAPPAAAAAEGPTVPADEVGAAFALQYFKIMKTRPNDLFCFYNSDSRVSRGTFSATSGTVDVRHACGPIRIRELLQKEHSYGTRLSLAIINNLEAQDSAAGAVIVQITGTLKFVDDTSRDFVMSTFLVHQDSTSAFDYYVLNDILIFQQQTQPQDSRQQLPAECRQAPLDKPQQRTMCNNKQGFNLPQQTRLTQEPIDPVNPPVAPSAQPAAAALPTTTAPQLSGATNTPMASNDDLLVSLGSPNFSDNHDDPNMAQQQQFSLGQQSAEGSEFDEQHQDESVISDGEQQSGDSNQQRESFGDLHESVISEERNESVMTDHEQQQHGSTGLGAVGGMDEREATTTESRQGSPTEKEAAAAGGGGGSGTAATATAAPSREKKSVWKTTPVTSISSPEGFADISAAVSPTDKSKQQQQQLLQPSGKSTEVATSLSSASTASKPFHPVDPSLYSESSYAAKLLRPGPNGLRAPCQTGFAVPPANGKLAQEKRERRPVQSYRNRPGRGKTLWVSLLPAEMTDEQIKKAVADSLRGQSCEGHVIRIERLPNQQHGYIELDTEMCAKLLIDKGLLHLQGRPVTVDFPGKNQNQRQGGGGGGGGGNRRRSFHQRNDGEEGTDEARRQFQQQQQQPQQQQQRRGYNSNFQRYTSGYNNSNGSAANADGLANGSNSNVANAAPHNSTSSSLMSQENEEGWTPATARHRKPPQANRPRFPQQQQQQNYNNSGNNNNNPLNRRQNSDGTNQNGSNRNGTSNNNNRRQNNQQQQRQQQQPVNGTSATANQ